MSSEDSKWDCSKCTYRNYQVSRKCVMCDQPRPSRVICDIENSEQDIYKVAELEARNNECAKPSNMDTMWYLKDYWTCEHCTSRNHKDSYKCYQCKMLPSMKVPESSESDSGSPSENLAILPSKSVVKSQAQKPSGSSSISPELTHKVSTSMFGLIKSLKWPCQCCTYDNQPKNKKCAMCDAPRGQKEASTKIVTQQVISTNLQLEIDVNTKNQENIRSAQNSPNKPNNEKEEPNSTSRINKSMQQSDNNRFSPGSNQRSGQNSPHNSSGHNSPNSQRASPSFPNNNMNVKNDCIIPYSSSHTDQKSQKQTSPKSNRPGPVSPQEHVMGQSSPTNNKRGSPIVARSSKSNRNQNRTRNEGLSGQDGAGAIGGFREIEERRERKLQKLRKKLTTEDLVWISACESVVKGDPSGIERYLTSGGDPARQLTKDEVLLLERPSAFEVGYTLVHLALRFRRDDMVAILLTATEISSKGFKRLPSYMCPDISSAIRRDISVMLRQKKGTFPCYFLTEFCTFTLPADIEDLPRQIQTQLFEEILDTDVEKELIEELVINWSVELSEKHGSRLYALWNRTAGDCLLDSVLQATWGILDVDNTLRKALADSLTEGANSFYPKWKEYEMRQADMLNFTLDDDQWHKDWTVLLNLASQPGASLEQMHIFALAHILRRPIIVYGVKVVKSFRGESIDYARFEGVYLPLLWDRQFCSKVPIALGYTRGHFSALVPMEMDTDMPLGAGAHIDNAPDEQIFYLPLMDHEGTFLPIHFVSGSEIGQDETIFRRWFECYVTQDAHFVAIQKIGKRPPLVNQMLEVWLDHYRQQAHTDPRLAEHGLSSESESDQE